MEQPEPIKQRGAYIADHTALPDLGNTLQYLGGSIMNLREAVDGYFQAVERAMERKIDEVRAELQRAQQALSAAQAALSSCRSQRYYDDEKERYVEPDCSCEERDVRDAEREVNRIEKILKKLEDIKSEVDREFSEYRRARGMIVPGGGDSVLEYLGKEHTQSATARLEEIMTVVKEYLTTSMSKQGGTLPDSEVFGDYQNELTPSKAQRFREASQKVLDKQTADNYGSRQINKANAIALCSKCGRPPVACICQRDSLERERLNIIFNNNYSR